MAQFIREHCDEKARKDASVRRVHERYIHLKHRLASANIRLAAHVAKRFRHHGLSYADLLQEAVCGLMLAIDRFDVSHGTRLSTYATWSIRQMLQIAVAHQKTILDEKNASQQIEATPVDERPVEVGIQKVEYSGVLHEKPTVPATSDRQEVLTFLMENLRPRDARSLTYASV